jgi:Rps23 Pro-64 3,4-dihydroxylase Tpa1-like proline 4-hydroxylase
MTYLNSEIFLKELHALTGINSLYADYGLHGGGQHMHGRGGKLNVHLDYSIHPKIDLERKLNLIIYLTPGWRKEWGGELGLWSHDQNSNQPKDVIKKIVPIFNRAVIFDTTQNSWHGLPDPIDCPQEVTRNSLASYYLITPSNTAKDRHKALFAPTEAQKNDSQVLELIAKRSDLKTAGSVYGDK